MANWSVQLEDGRVVHLDAPYGHEHTLSRAGAYEATILLSPINCRIQVYGHKIRDFSVFASDVRALALRNNYGKVWIKARAADRPALERVGFECEATIPGFFDGPDAACMTLFLSDDRRHRPHLAEEQEILAKILATPPAPGTRLLAPGYASSIFAESDAKELAALYKTVFPTYPYPIDDPGYLIETARTHIIYRVVRDSSGKIVASASAETMPDLHNSEMTDFASLPSERGKGHAQYILQTLESDARERFGIRCYYTIARALSFAMLRTFHNAGYQLTGTMVNNCSIDGKFETMHLMCRPYPSD